MVRKQIEKVFKELEKAMPGELVKDAQRLNTFLANKERLLLLKPKILQLADGVQKARKQVDDLDQRLDRLESQ